MIGTFGILILIYSLFTICITLVSHRDFFKRNFNTTEEKNKWRKKIFSTWTGKFEYFFRIVLTGNKKIKNFQ